MIRKTRLVRGVEGPKRQTIQLVRWSEKQQSVDESFQIAPLFGADTLACCGDFERLKTRFRLG